MMSNDREKRDPEEMSVELNEAFERLEAKAASEAAAGDSVSEAGTEAPVSPGPRSDEPAARPRSGSPLGAIALLLALIAIGIASGAAYTAWFESGANNDTNNAGTDATDRLEQRLNDIERQLGSDSRVDNAIERLSELEQQVSTRREAVEDVRARLDDVSARLAAGDDNAEFERLVSRVDRAIAGLRSEMGTTSRDWLLAEVEYLIRLGAQRVEMQQDASGALVMFQTADQVLQSAEGVAAFGLREALANDIAELQAVSTIDVDGIYVKLGALKSQVDELRQAKRDFEPAPAGIATVGADATLMQRFMTFVGNVGSRLASLVDYRRDEEVVKPILPPREEYYLRQNLVFQLQLAQLALLQENQAIFDNSINEAQTWIERHFDPEHPVTQTMTATLNELAGLDITRDMPDVSESLRAVRQTLDRFHTESGRNQVR